MTEQTGNRYLKELEYVLQDDLSGLEKAEQSYGDSWKRRGGVGAYMMAARKIDRLENQVKKHNYDIFEAAEADERAEGVIDDIRDLRRYLALIEAELRARGCKSALSVHRDNVNIQEI